MDPKERIDKHIQSQNNVLELIMHLNPQMYEQSFGYEYTSIDIKVGRAMTI